MKKQKNKKILVFVFVVCFAFAVSVEAMAADTIFTYASAVAYRYRAVGITPDTSSYKSPTLPVGQKRDLWVSSANPQMYRYYFFLRFPQNKVIPANTVVALKVNFWMELTSPDDTTIQMYNNFFDVWYGEAYWATDGTNTWGADGVSPRSVDIVHQLGSENPCEGLSWLSQKYSYFSYIIGWVTSRDINMAGLYLTPRVAPYVHSCQCVLDYAVIAYQPADSSGSGSGSGSGSSGGDSAIVTDPTGSQITIDFNWPKTNKTEVETGLSSADENLTVLEDGFFDAFHSAYESVDLNLGNVITGDVLTSVNWFSGKVQDFFNRNTFISILVTVSLVLGSLGVLLGFFKRRGSGDD